MRVCKLTKSGENMKLMDKFGMYAEVEELVESPTGMKARLRFPQGHRELVAVQRVRMLQQDVPKSRGSFWD